MAMVAILTFHGLTSLIPTLAFSITYEIDGKQYISNAAGGGRSPAEIITLGLH